MFILIVPSTATLIIFKVQRRLVRREVKHRIIEGIDKSELVLLKFAKDETDSLLHWKHSREFRFKGEMYDVVEKESRSDSVYFWCWWDNDETELCKKLDRLLTHKFHKDPTKNKVQSHLFKFFKNLFPGNALAERTDSIVKNNQSSFYFNIYEFYYSPPPGPPPEIL